MATKVIADRLCRLPCEVVVSQPDRIVTRDSVVTPNDSEKLVDISVLISYAADR